MYASVFTKWNYGKLFGGELLKLGLTVSDYIVLVLAVLLVLYVSLKSRSASFREQLAAKPFAVRYLSYFVLIVSILVFGAYGVGYDASQFIYSQF